MDEQQLREQLESVYQSTSWRITAPIRAVAGLIYRKKTQSNNIKVIFRKFLSWLARSSTLYRIAGRVLSIVPGTKVRLIRLMNQTGNEAGLHALEASSYLTPEDLNSPAQEILHELSILVLDAAQRKKRK